MGPQGCRECESCRADVVTSGSTRALPFPLLCRASPLQEWVAVTPALLQQITLTPYTVLSQCPGAHLSPNLSVPGRPSTLISTLTLTSPCLDEVLFMLGEDNETISCQVRVSIFVACSVVGRSIRHT